MNKYISVIRCNTDTQPYPRESESTESDLACDGSTWQSVLVRLQKYFIQLIIGSLIKCVTVINFGWGEFLLLGRKKGGKKERKPHFHASSISVSFVPKPKLTF